MGKALRLATGLAILFIACTASAAGGGTGLHKAGNDPDDIESLQRGARNFMNYCSGCHSAKYVRYDSIARGLKLSEDQVVDYLMFNADKLFDTVRSSMPADDAARWFGKQPPDMSLLARSKSTDYIYTFLHSFYLDPDSPSGVDNLLLSGTSMPHVLWELQGFQRAVFVEHETAGGESTSAFDHFESVSAGSMTSEEFDDFVRDTVNFLEYLSEPIRATRRKIGVGVLLFLTFFLFVAWKLEKEIWKDVPK